MAIPSGDFYLKGTIPFLLKKTTLNKKPISDDESAPGVYEFSGEYSKESENDKDGQKGQLIFD